MLPGSTLACPYPSAEDCVLARFAAFRERQIRVLEQLAAGSTLTWTFDAVVRMIQEQSPATIASVLVLSEDGLHLRHGAAPDLPVEYCQAIDGIAIGPSVGSCGTAAFRGQRVIVSDVATDPLWADYKELALHHGLRSCWSEPIVDSRGKVMGSFAMYHRYVAVPDEEELQIIRVAANLAGIGIERERMERKLLETQKLESLGVLAGGVAHDFNNLLTGILGNASLIRMELPDHAPAQEMLGDVEKLAQRAADLCRQMLAFAGKGRFVVERLDLSALVEDSERLLHLSISKNAVLSFDLQKNIPPIQADATQLRQIVMNLVINASEAIGERSGRILVSTGLMTVDRAYLTETYLSPDLPEGDYVFLEVSDNGTGMSAETLSRIFDPFFTTKFTGRGLGLAAVLGIVRGHHGALKVYSEPGRGTTFKLLLPGVDGPAETADAENPAARAVGKGTVLVVDDEETVRAVASRMLQAQGFQVVTAPEGSKALALFREQEFQMVLLDLTMPHMSGEETFREIRQLQPNARILLMSGYSEQEATNRFTGKGLSGFVQKPFTPESLLAKLMEVLA
jgi:signal transduction histidine kinase/CheY-like chemotaxis protein